MTDRVLHYYKLICPAYLPQPSLMFGDWSPIAPSIVKTLFGRCADRMHPVRYGPHTSRVRRDAGKLDSLRVYICTAYSGIHYSRFYILRKISRMRDRLWESWNIGHVGNGLSSHSAMPNCRYGSDNWGNGFSLREFTLPFFLLHAKIPFNTSVAQIDTYIFVRLTWKMNYRRMICTYMCFSNEHILIIARARTKWSKNGSSGAMIIRIPRKLRINSTLKFSPDVCLMSASYICAAVESGLMNSWMEGMRGLHKYGHSEEVRDSRLQYTGCANNYVRERPFSYRLFNECGVVLRRVAQIRLRRTTVDRDVVILQY